MHSHTKVPCQIISFLCVLGIVFFALDIFAAEESPHAPNMMVGPSASKVALGTANLTFSTLEHQKNAYMGSYQLKVTPYSFKNEKGTLFLNASDEVVRKISAGKSVEFTGKATNAENGRVKIVKGKTTPETNDHGVVSFSVLTENGAMVFNTSYRLLQK